MCNFFGIILPGILSYLVWTLHFNATRKKNILKSLFVLAFSICPIMNWISFGAFIIIRIKSMYDDEGFNPFKESQEYEIGPFAMYIPYDKTTKCGKIIYWFVKDR